MSRAEGLNSTVLFIGAPNSGKTTLYNWFTGSRFKTVNYPGATVDYSKGRPLPQFGVDYEVVDTPGIYSLKPKTYEEEVTTNLLFDTAEINKFDKLVVVVDATHFSRQMIIADHLKSCGFSVVVALTMVDVLKNKGIQIEVDKLSEALDLPIVLIDGRLGGNVDKLAMAVSKAPAASQKVSYQAWGSERYQERFQHFDQLRNQYITEKQSKTASVFKLDHQIDRWLLHPVFGLAIFIGIMFLMFSSIFSMAGPLIDFVDEQFVFLADWVISFDSNSLFLQFIANGLIAGIGAFAVFVPQIAILFLGLGFLEDTGYLARASTLIDKPLSRLGLNGRSFVPLLSSFACAIPGMMAARTIPNKKERWLTLFIIPLMTCSARLPVYALLLTFLFIGESSFKAGFYMSLIYFLSLIIGALTAVIVNRFLPQTSRSFFILELPSYRLPVLRKWLRQVYDKTIAFVFRAGPVILVLSVIIWAGSTFPNYNMADETERFNSSYAAELGQWLEPAFKPMGADWRVGLGLITSFAAREVFVSSLAVVFNASELTEAGTEASLLTKMQNATFINADGVEALVFTPASVAAIIVFFIFALQCMATVGIAKVEFGGWKFALIQLAVFNIAAYVFAVATYQLLS